ncbi:fructose-bisphosphate aldolase, class II [Pneumocystis carinii B80]|uniref:Fructose-bisphosphate aldolase n=1 Tax=Pneumocystis carinii (strain B80) TaxID=1408658 RepID=A0A0W4ZBL9_PNEC8|nr:fructose-bisphosphate aldolase, class II [Pneumocystis carinii B80]KTW25708.1 fructose-bisphosphate aldolase, class II [Pneumocystis carinii B80]
MGISSIVPSGVITGDDVLKLFKYAKENQFAIPAVNCTSSSTIVAVLEAAKSSNSPIIIQISQGGAAYFAGKSLNNDKQQASIAGAISAAYFVRTIAPSYNIPVVLHTDHCSKKLLPWLDGMIDADEKYFEIHKQPLFSSHMIDLSEESKEHNIELTKHYLQRVAPMKQWLEVEIGITGGEEDGVNNEEVSNVKLYTQSEDVFDIYSALSAISPYFSIAAAFGNVHGVYAPGGVFLRPELLKAHQDYAEQKLNCGKKPIFFVFHGGSGSSLEEYHIAIENGVVKINIDTDTQYFYLEGVRNYILSKKEYLMSPVGNPEGLNKPNKKFFDPRVWLREGEKSMCKKVQVLLNDFKTINTL